MPPKHTYTHAWMHAHIWTVVEFILRGFGLLSYFFLDICQMYQLWEEGELWALSLHKIFLLLLSSRNVCAPRKTLLAAGGDRLASSIPLQVLEGDP